MMPVRTHSARAEGFGKTARATAALQRRRSDSDFVFPPAPNAAVSAGGDVCRILKCSSDGWVRPAVRRPHKRAVVSTLLPHFSDFISLMRKFTIECRLCSISASCRCTRPGPHCVQGQQSQ